MEDVIYPVAKWLYSVQTEILILIAVIAVFVRQRAGYQNKLRGILTESPLAMFVVEERSGRLLIANRPAMQLLGIRLMGNRYRYPSRLAQASLCEYLQGKNAEGFKHDCQSWVISEAHKINVDLSGQKIHYKGNRSWLIQAVFHPESASDKELARTSLTVARAALDSLSELIYIKDNSGKLVDMNKAFNLFWEGRRDEGCIDVGAGEVLKGRQSKRHWTVDPHGRGCLLETAQTTLMSGEGEVIGTLGISHDVTDWYKMQQDLRDEMEKRKGTEQALAHRDTILQSLLESSPDAIALYNENKVFEACNQAYASSIGVPSHIQLVGMRMEDVLPEHLYKEFIKTDRKVMRKGTSLRFREQSIGVDGEPKWFDVVKSPYHDPISGVSGVLVMARDVTESHRTKLQLEEMNEQLEEWSFLDGLTQIANRRRFDEQLGIIWKLHKRQKSSLAVMLGDIDFFKDFNDNYGHQKGDETLRLVAQSFLESLNRETDCVARYGGEEFAFIIPNMNERGALHIASKIHDVISELNIKHEHSSVSDRITLSIGVVAKAPEFGDTPDKLVEYADQALYLAKKQGRNQTRVYRG